MIARLLRGENASALRGLTGQGEPGKWTLLGGTSPEIDDARLAGGFGQVSGTARLARANRDIMLAGVASGGVGPATQFGDPNDIYQRDWRDRYRSQR